MEFPYWQQSHGDFTRGKIGRILNKLSQKFNSDNTYKCLETVLKSYATELKMLLVQKSSNQKYSSMILKQQDRKI